MITETTSEKADGKRRIFCPLDLPDPVAAVALARSLQNSVGGLKIGLEFFAANGPQGCAEIAALGLPVFLDLKFHDIPNTVRGAVMAACAIRPAMMTLHISGGPAMMKAARDSADQASQDLGIPRPTLLGVTVLTSLDNHDLKLIGMTSQIEDQVRRLGELAQNCGLDGLVCSPKEIGLLRGVCGNDMILVVPGIRPAGTATGDQKRIMTPGDAIAAGADYLVIGRPITQAPNPVDAATAIAREITGALARK